MSEITEPLRLTVGTHAAGSGRGCAMNVLSWENGDTEITDFPSCADPLLAQLIQVLNDTYCTHLEKQLGTVQLVRDSDGAVLTVTRQFQMLCPSCSVTVLDVAHKLVGTTLPASLDLGEIIRIHLATLLRLTQSYSPFETDLSWQFWGHFTRRVLEAMMHQVAGHEKDVCARNYERLDAVLAYKHPDEAYEECYRQLESESQVMLFYRALANVGVEVSRALTSSPSSVATEDLRNAFVNAYQYLAAVVGKSDPEFFAEVIDTFVDTAQVQVRTVPAEETTAAIASMLTVR